MCSGSGRKFVPPGRRRTRGCCLADHLWLPSCFCSSRARLSPRFPARSEFDLWTSWELWHPERWPATVQPEVIDQADATWCWRNWVCLHQVIWALAGSQSDVCSFGLLSFMGSKGLWHLILTCICLAFFYFQRSYKHYIFDYSYSSFFKCIFVIIVELLLPFFVGLMWKERIAFKITLEVQVSHRL